MADLKEVLSAEGAFVYDEAKADALCGALSLFSVVSKEDLLEIERAPMPEPDPFPFVDEVIAEPEPVIEPVREEEPQIPEEENVFADMAAEFSAKFGDDDVKTLNDSFSQEKQTLADTLGRGRVENLEAGLSLNQRFRFANELFSGNKDEFRQALASIERQASYDEAVALLKNDYVMKHGWEMNDETVRDFLNLLSRSFG